MGRARIAIVHDGFVPTYRVPLYEALAQIDDVEYVVFHGEPPDDIAHLAARPPFAFAHREVAQRVAQVAGRRVIYQRLLREIVRGFDAVVLGAWMRFASTHAVRAAFEALGRPVVYWGHGGHVTHDVDTWSRRVVNARECIKMALARSVDAYLAYTPGGAAKLVEHGVDPARVYALGNTIDMEWQRGLLAECRAADEPALRRTLGAPPDAPVVVYLGRFVPEKRVDDLLTVERLVNERRRRPVQFVLIGDGPERARIRSLAAGRTHVRLPGALDDRDVARWLACAAAVALPGRVGLVANHAFAHGVPVVARITDLNAPEVEYVEDGRNGMLVDGDVAAFGAALAGLVDAPDRRERLATGALATAETLGLAPMVRTFDAGVRAALGRRGFSAAAVARPQPLA